MALSFKVFPATAGQGPYNLAGLDYDDPATLAVEVDAAPATFTVDRLSRRLTILTPTVAAGQEVRVTRTTGRLESDLPERFAVPVLDAAELNRAYRHLMLLCQEAQERTMEEIDLQGIFLKPNGHWGAEDLRMENLADGVFDTDGATMNQLAIADAGARLLPPVTGADNDSGLFVVAGEWAVRTPTQSRVHLGLGDVALATAGTGASQVPQLNGSAQYPGNDGQLIDLDDHPLTALVETKELSVALGLRSTPSLAAILNFSADVNLWPQVNGTRVLFSSTPFTATAVNAPASEIDPTPTAPNAGIRLAQGLWRVVWSCAAQHNAVSSTASLIGLAWTSAEDSSSQTIYQRPFNNFRLEFLAGSLNKPSAWSGEFIVSNPSASQRTLCLRRNLLSGPSPTSFLYITVVIQKISDTPDAAFPQLTS